MSNCFFLVFQSHFFFFRLVIFWKNSSRFIYQPLQKKLTHVKFWSSNSNFSTCWMFQIKRYLICSIIRLIKQVRVPKKKILFLAITKWNAYKLRVFLSPFFYAFKNSSPCIWFAKRRIQVVKFGSITPRQRVPKKGEQNKIL